MGGDEVKLQGPGGIGVSVSGQNIVMYVLMACALGGMIYVEHVDRKANVKLFETILCEMRNEHARILSGEGAQQRQCGETPSRERCKPAH